jgi:hypothetical protein
MNNVLRFYSAVAYRAVGRSPAVACQGRLKVHPFLLVENAPSFGVRRLRVERGA